MAKHRPDRFKGLKSHTPRTGQGPRPGGRARPQSGAKPNRPARRDGPTGAGPGTKPRRAIETGSKSGGGRGGERAAAGGSAGPKLERLQKVLAQAGLGSRRGCEELVLKGRVTVNGEVVRLLGTRVDPETARIAVDGEPIRREAMVYFAVNKPRGYVSTNFDPAGRPRVVDLLPEVPERVYSVGRLDEDSTGLMILTNDGELAHGLAHPRFGVEKLYRALVAGAPEPETIARLTEGVWLSDGKVRAKRARIVGRRGQATTIELVLAEGKKREVRRMLSKLGHKVMSLTRLAVGPVTLKGLPSGECRPLARREVEMLRKAASGQPVPSPSDAFGKRRVSSGPPSAPPRERRDGQAQGRSQGPGARRGASDRPAVPTDGARRAARPGDGHRHGHDRGPKPGVGTGPAAHRKKPAAGEVRPKLGPKPGPGPGPRLGSGPGSSTVHGAGAKRERTGAGAKRERPGASSVQKPALALSPAPAPARPMVEDAPRGRRIIGLKVVGRPDGGAGRPSARRSGPPARKRPSGRKTPPPPRPKRPGPSAGAGASPSPRERNDEEA